MTCNYEESLRACREALNDVRGAVFADIDGTISHIAERPEEALIPAAADVALTELSSSVAGRRAGDGTECPQRNRNDTRNRSGGDWQSWIRANYRREPCHRFGCGRRGGGNRRVHGDDRSEPGGKRRNRRTRL